MPAQSVPTASGSLSQSDPDVAQALADEREGQINNLELIASENFVSKAVLEAIGYVATNRYAEATRAVAITAAAR